MNSLNSNIFDIPLFQVLLIVRKFYLDTFFVLFYSIGTYYERICLTIHRVINSRAKQKLSLLSTTNPSNSTSADSFITSESISKLYFGRLFLLRIINWNFSRFALVELILNQLKTFFISQVKFSMTLYRSWLQQYDVLSLLYYH